MGISYNRCILAGNVTRDPEQRFTPGGKAVCDLGLAINEQYKDAQGKVVEDCVFVDVTLFGRTAEVAAQYLTKGAPVLIEGRLKLDQWDDKNGGGKRTKLKVVGDRMQLLGGGKGEGGQSRGQSGGRQQQQSQHDDFGGGDDDAPF